MSRDKATVALGRSLMNGAMMELGKWSIICAVGIAAFNYADAKLHLTTWDNTDGRTYHSGLRPLTDHLTGCQYLVSRDGGLIQRIGRDGRQICTETAR